MWISPFCTNAAHVEATLHERMKSYRALGEWFRVPFDIVVGMARQSPYEVRSRYEEVRLLAEAAEMVRPPSA